MKHVFRSGSSRHALLVAVLLVGSTGCTVAGKATSPPVKPVAARPAVVVVAREGATATPVVGCGAACWDEPAPNADPAFGSFVATAAAAQSAAQAAVRAAGQSGVPTAVGAVSAENRHPGSGYVAATVPTAVADGRTPVPTSTSSRSDASPAARATSASAALRADTADALAAALGVRRPERTPTVVGAAIAGSTPSVTAAAPTPTISPPVRPARPVPPSR